MALEVGAGTAGSFDGMHCELVDTRATKPDAVVWGHNYGMVVDKDCKRFYDEGKRHLFATFEMIALETWRSQNPKLTSLLTQQSWTVSDQDGYMTLQSSDVAPFEVDSIEKLAEALKLSPSKLKNAVDEFNAACNEKQFNLMALDGKATVRLNPNKTN